MNDIKVAYKMLILVVIAAIALMFVGKSGYTAIQKANDDMDTMYNQKLQAIYNIGECKAMMREMQSRTALAMGNIDAKRMQELKDYYQKAGETFARCAFTTKVPSVGKRVVRDRIPGSGSLPVEYSRSKGRRSAATETRSGCTHQPKPRFARRLTLARGGYPA